MTKIVKKHRKLVKSTENLSKIDVSQEKMSKKKLENSPKSRKKSLRAIENWVKMDGKY